MPRASWLFRALLIAYLVIVLWLVLFKFSTNLSTGFNHHSRSLNLIPFSGSSPANSVANLVVFVPLGALIGLNFSAASLGRKLAFVVSLSVGVELTQFIFAIGATDITDVITNSVGGLIGLLGYDLASRHLEPDTLNRVSQVAAVFLTTVVALVLVVLLMHRVRFQPAEHPRQ